MAEDVGATVNDWLKVVRRARLGAGVKAVCYYLAGRANNDGTRLFPGVARTAVECEISYTSARRALALLRKVGLIERVRQGNRRMHQADEYRLILAVDLLDRIDVPNPEEHTAAIGKLNMNNRDRARDRASALSQVDADSPGSALSQVDADSPGSALSQVDADGAISVQMGPSSASTTDRAPHIDHLSGKDNSHMASGMARGAARSLRSRAAEAIIAIIDSDPSTVRWSQPDDHDSKIVGALQLTDLLIAEAKQRGEPISDLAAYVDTIGRVGLAALWRRAVGNDWRGTRPEAPVWDVDGTRYTS